MPSNPTAFPKNFVWGVAAAAPQIEGAAFVDGKGESIWDKFSRIPGKVLNGDTLDVACDHYNRFREDFALMRELGIKDYRLSISWPRIFPKGDGSLNQAGLDFYHRLFDSMAENGITPWVTLFHWDLPQSLEDRGGWINRVTVDAFGPYADVVVKAFAGKVKNWITLNEIRCFTQLAYGPTSYKAPARRVSELELNQSYHNALLCHGLGVRAVRNHGGAGARVGITDNCDVGIPITETPKDIAATRAWYIDRNLHVLDPVYRGGYAEAYLKRVGRDAPKVEAGDMELIGGKTDFLGLNLYTACFIREGRDGKPEACHVPPGFPQTDSPWLKIMPQAIYWGPRLAHETYGPEEIYITENGCGYDSDKVENGEVVDLHRREFLRSYLRELNRATLDGVPVKGYFLWSFMDNYEWEDGYTRRFGIVHVDFKTQKRTPKLSARYYSEVMKQNRVL